MISVLSARTLSALGDIEGLQRDRAPLSQEPQVPRLRTGLLMPELRFPLYSYKGEVPGPADLKERLLQVRPTHHPGLERYLTLIAGLGLEMLERFTGSIDRSSTALILCHRGPGLATLAATLFEVASARQPISMEQVFQLGEARYVAAQISDFLQVLVRLFDIRGRATLLSSACATGMSAIDVADSWLATGKARHVLVLAAETPVTGLSQRWFGMRDDFHVSSEARLHRPYDFASRTGDMVLGEAAAALLLSADRNDARCGRLAAPRLAAQIWDVSAAPTTAPPSTILSGLMAETVAASEMTPSLAILSGASDRATDQTEMHALERLDHGAIELGPYFKRWIGHSLSASSLVETALTLQFHRQLTDGTAILRSTVALDGTAGTVMVLRE